MSKKEKTYEDLLKAHIVSSLRNSWKKSPHRAQHLRDTKVGTGTWVCAYCEIPLSASAVKVDHKEKIVPPDTVQGHEWGEYMRKLFYGKLQNLCKECHDMKTKNERMAKLV